MTKVMMVVPSIKTGGGEKVAISIAKHINREQFEVLLVSLYPYTQTLYAQEIAESKINTCYLSKHLGFDFHVIRELKKVIAAFRPDVIHTHLYVVPYVLLSAPRKTVKYHTVHNIAEKEATGTLRKFMRIAYAIGNFIPVTISPFCRQTFVELYHYKKLVPCIYNGVDVKHFKPEPIAHQTFKFICVGRFETQKNHALLLRAFAAVYKKHPDTVLELVGDGPLRPVIQEQVEEMGMSSAVIMDGISGDIVGKNNAADVFVLSSDFEGLPVSVLEAMACGLPIVSTDAGGTCDVVQNEENGIIVPVGDEQALAEAMLRLRENGDLRKIWGAKSRQLALSYSIENFVKQYEKLYQSKGGK